MTLTEAIAIATADYRLVVDEPDLTVQEFLDAARSQPYLTRRMVDDWPYTDGGLGVDTAAAYYAVLDAAPRELAAALLSLHA